MAYQPVSYPPQQRRGLGVAALVLGIVAIITLLLCGLGVLVAIAGLIVGALAVVRDNGRRMAILGIILSALTLVIAIGFSVWFFTRISPCTDRAKYPTKAERDNCLQARVPFFKATTRPVP